MPQILITSCHNTELTSLVVNDGTYLPKYMRQIYSISDRLFPVQMECEGSERYWRQTFEGCEAYFLSY